MNDIEPYKNLIGRQVLYMKDGKARTGILLTIEFDDYKNRLVAEIQTEYKIPLFGFSFKARDLVAVKRIQVPACRNQTSSPACGHHSEPVAHRTRSNTAALSPCFGDIGMQNRFYNQQHFVYHHKTYVACDIPWLKLNGEAVWSLPQNLNNTSTECPYVGKIRFLGRHISVMGEEERVALVEFDQCTKHLPGFVSQAGKYFSSVVKPDELLCLDDWLVTNAYGESFSPNTSTVSEPEPGSPTPFKFPSVALLREKILEHSEQASEPKSPQARSTTQQPERPLIDLSEDMSKLSIASGAISVTEKEVWRKGIDSNSFVKIVLAKTHSVFGIQGNNNSCYMDASLFALFSFSHALDDLISFQLTDITQKHDSIKQVLRENIVRPLRVDGYVPFESTLTLRQILGTENSKFLQSYMDAEDFMLTLFESLNTPPMFEYDSGNTDYIHQIIVHPKMEGSRKLGVLTVQTLLNGSFITSDVKLARPPEGLFILKLPVCDGELMPCERVIPDLSLDLTEIISEKCHTKRKAETMFHLSAVICFHQSHYVAFVRTERNILSPWVFMDSRPTNGKPMVTVLHHTGRLIMDSLDELYNGKKMCIENIPQEEQQFARRLTTDAYICIYENSLQK